MAQQPIIFTYQKVLQIAAVQPEGLAGWQQRMRDLVGFEGQIILQQGWVETDSFCPSPTFDD